MNRQYGTCIATDILNPSPFHEVLLQGIFRIANPVYTHQANRLLMCCHIIYYTQAVLVALTTLVVSGGKSFNIESLVQNWNEPVALSPSNYRLVPVYLTSQLLSQPVEREQGVFAFCSQ